MWCIMLSGSKPQREGGSGPALMLSTKMCHLKGSNYVDSWEIEVSPAFAFNRNGPGGGAVMWGRCGHVVVGGDFFRDS